MNETDARLSADDAATSLQGWLDGRLLLSKAAVRTLLWERAELLADRARITTELERAHDQLAQDVRAVQALTSATARLWSVPADDIAARDTLLAAVHDRADDLFALFAARIAALAIETGTKGGDCDG